MDASTSSVTGAASASRTNTHSKMVKSNTTHMRDTPMPCSGAALSKVFETYAPTGALKPGAQGHFTEHLTWSFLQNDPNCQELSELRTIIATIFAYSQRNFLNPPSQLELAAGIRYFLPTGELAPEWIKFFDVAPGRYLGMAPMEVQNAYEREHDWSTTTMRQWVDAGVAARRLELAGSNHTASSVSWTQSRALERKRRHSEVSNQDEDVAEQQSPYFHANAKGDANFSSPVLPYSVHHEFGSDPLSLYEGEASRPVDMASFWQSHAVAQPCHGSMDTIFGNGGEHGADMPRILPNDTVASAGTAPAFTTVDQKRQRREGAQEGAVPSWSMPPPYHPSQYDLSPTRVDPASLQPVVDMNAVLLTGNPTQTVPSPAVLATPSIGDPALEKDLVDHSSAIHPQSSAPQQAHSGPHPAQHAAAIASGPQMSVNAPGSQTHRGKGFCQKGWSEDRVRAWTDIQGRPRGKLPKAALSPWGDEMSRGHTPKSVDPRHCPFETTMEENLTYLTMTTTTNRQMCARTMANWTAQECVHYVYWALDLQDPHSYGRTTVQKQFTKCKEWQTLNPGVPRTADMSNLRPDNNLNGVDKESHDYFLHAMGKNVVNHPTGQGRNNLSIVIDHVLNVSGDKAVRLSEAAQYAQRHNLALVSQHRLLMNPVSNDGPDANLIADARAAYAAKFGKPA